MVAHRADHLVAPVLEIHAAGLASAPPGKVGVPPMSSPSRSIRRLWASVAVVPQPDRQRPGAPARPPGRGRTSTRPRSPRSVEFGLTVTLRTGSSSSSPPQPARQSRIGAGDREATHGERILCAAVSARSPSSAPWPRCPAGRLRRRDRGPRGRQTARRGAGAVLRALLRLPLARRGQRVRLEAGRRSSRAASAPTGRTSTCARSSRDDVLYAIRNGGFSGAIMPANIVVGERRRGGGRLPGRVLRRGERRERPDLLRRVRASSPRGVAVLDLRQIRDDPEPARAALRAARLRPGRARRGARARRAPAGAPARARGAAAAQERGLEADRRAAARAARTRPRRSRRSGGVSAREKELDEELRAVEERRTAALAALPEPARRDRARRRTRCCARRASPAAPAAATSSCSATTSTSRPARAWRARASST